MSWCSTVAAIFVNTFVNAIALDAIGWKYYFVFIVMLIILLLCAYFGYPETRGYTLEQIAVIFDGEDAIVPHASEKIAEVEHDSKEFDSKAEHKV